MRKILFILLITINSYIHILEAQNQSWKTYTSLSPITDICLRSNFLWAASEGGVLSFDKDSESFLIITNTEGLCDNNVTSISSDDSGRIWMGFKNGTIQRLDPESGDWFEEDAYNGYEIKSFIFYGDTIFIGLDIGISLYIISKKEVKETYHKLGNQFQSEIPVNDVITGDGYIWAATDFGIAYCRLDSTNLMDPNNWTDITITDGLPSNKINSIIIFNNQIYAGTSKGIAKRVQGAWIVLTDVNTSDLTIFKDSLYASSGNSVLVKQNDSFKSISTFTDNVYLIESNNNSLWATTEDSIYLYTEDGKWRSFRPDCPASNLISSIDIDKNGVLWCSSRDKGFFSYNGNNWEIYDKNRLSRLRFNDFVSIIVDKSNNKWAGSWGDGVVFVGDDGSIRYYNAKNGYFSGISVDPYYAVIIDIAVDKTGTIWFINREAVNGQPVVSLTTDSVWTYYGSNEGITSIFLSAIAVDNQGRKWIGSNTLGAKGIFVLDDNNTPADKSDDPPVMNITKADGLGTNEITDLAVDRDGVVWIGTPNGLYYYYNGTIYRKYGLPSENVRAILVDGINNLWVATSAGVSFFSNDAYSWTLYNKQNSYLVSDDVNTLSLDKNNGKMYIGTSKGISCIQTQFSEPRTNLNQLLIYPNPFMPERHEILNIYNLAYQTTVYIYSTSGHIVKKFTPNSGYGRSIQWDGRNESGEYVAGGIYLVVAVTEKGEKKIAKLALIR